MKIKDLPKVDRPREKLEKYGPERLSDSELLAILLRTGSEGVNVVELAGKILRKFSGVGLAKASVKELKNTFGLGSAKACEISACFELGRRLLQNKQSTLILSVGSLNANLVHPKQLVDAGKLLGIDISDHVIVSKANYFSFKEHKLI